MEKSAWCIWRRYDVTVFDIFHADETEKGYRKNGEKEYI